MNPNSTSAQFHPDRRALALILVAELGRHTGGRLHAQLGGVHLRLRPTDRRRRLAVMDRLPDVADKARYNDNVRRFVTLGIPGVISGGITQINIVVGTIIASMQASTVMPAVFAGRIYQLPLGVIGVAIGVVLLPDLTRRVRGQLDKHLPHPGTGRWNLPCR